MSSSDQSDKRRGKGRKRAKPFNPDDDEIDAIFLQLVTNNPFLHSRRGVNAAWKFHLDKLHDCGIAMDCVKQKTFTAWATRMCKDRYAFRLAESRKNGTGEVEPSTALDEVMRKWEIAKLAGKAPKDPLKAELMRAACTTTAQCLDAKTAKIKEAMSKKYGSGTSAPAASGAAARSNSPSPSGRQRASTPNSAAKLLSPPMSSGGSTVAGARLAFSDAMSSFSLSCESETHLMQEILSAMRGKETSHDETTPGEKQVPLRAVLESAGEEYRSLVPHASKIFDALGIADLQDFACVTEDDVLQVTLPAMQKRALIHLARAHNVGSKILS